MSGYDLRVLIQQSIGHFWNESFGQIYPSLRRLSEAGLIRPVKEAGGNGNRERQVYALTDAGMKKLQNWLPVPARKQVNRNELLLKLFFGRYADPSVIQHHLEECKQIASENLKVFQETEAALKRDRLDHPDLPFWLMTLRYGQAIAEAELRWSTESLNEHRVADLTEEEISRVAP